MIENAKAVDSLTVADLVADPVWQFADGDGVGETLVRAVKTLPVRDLTGKLVRPTRPTERSSAVEGSGTGTTATPDGALNPVISEAFTVAPEVLYSPIVPLPEFVSKSASPRAVGGTVKTAAATESMATAHRTAVKAVPRARCNERGLLSD